MEKIIKNDKGLEVFKESKRLMLSLLEKIKKNFLFFHGKSWEKFFEKENITLTPLLNQTCILKDEHNNDFYVFKTENILSKGIYNGISFYYSHKFLKQEEGKEFWRKMGEKIKLDLDSL